MQGETALVAVVQNAAGTIFDQKTIRPKAQASVPGDGAAVGLVACSDKSPILDIECRTYGEFAGDMAISMEPARKWWQPGPGEGSIGFTESKITKVLARGNRQVPEVSLCGVRPNRHQAEGSRPPGHQPAEPGVSAQLARRAGTAEMERHVDTFEECGNLFAAGIPVNLERAISDGQLKKGDVALMAAFAHAGDFAGAAAIKWGGRD